MSLRAGWEFASGAVGAGSGPVEEERRSLAVSATEPAAVGEDTVHGQARLPEAAGTRSWSWSREGTEAEEGSFAASEEL